MYPNGAKMAVGMGRPKYLPRHPLSLFRIGDFLFLWREPFPSSQGFLSPQQTQLNHPSPHTEISNLSTRDGSSVMAQL